MTIEIHRPELEALLRQHMESGRFQDLEEILMRALQPRPDEHHVRPFNEVSESAFGQRLIEVCAMVKGMTEDVDFGRSPSLDRPLDLS